MSKLPKEYLKHILDEVLYLMDSSANLPEERFMRDETFQRAFTRSLEIIGEAAKNLQEDFRKTHDNIDWRAISGMRDRLIHHYFGVDYDLVWDVVINEIPRLKADIEKILETLN